MELTDARIELATDSPRCRHARTVLAEEVARRAQQLWPAGHRERAADRPARRRHRGTGGHPLVRAGGAIVPCRGVRRAPGGVPHRPRRRHAPRHRQRCPRRAVRRGVAAAPPGGAPLLGAAARLGSGRGTGRHGAPLSPARAPDRLPAEDQLLRRLERGRVGAVPARAGPVRRQRGRGHPAPLGRRGRFRPLPPAPDRHDGRGVRHRRPLRHRPVDLVSGAG